VLSDKPPITSTIQSLPTPLLDSLLNEISTLASVYHKPPETFIGHGRYGAEAIQAAAIEEQKELQRENPIAADAAAAAVSGKTAPQSNIENLLDIDFDGAAPASMQKESMGGTNGLEGLAGTPQRTESPAVRNSPQKASAAPNNMDDLMGVFGNGTSTSSAPQGGAGDDFMNGFADLNMGAAAGASQPPPPQQQKKTNHDLMSLF